MLKWALTSSYGMCRALALVLSIVCVLFWCAVSVLEVSLFQNQIQHMSFHWITPNLPFLGLDIKILVQVD